jgi:carbon-monoxide dehydrogenase medium subunit
MHSSIVAADLPLIAQAMPHVAHVAVRNRGTFGGSIALADPSAELPACVLALEGIIVVESMRGKRTIAADDFFTGLYETARAADELLVEVLIPSQKPGRVSVFMELARRHGDFAIAGVACCARVSGEVIDDARLAYFGTEAKATLAVRTMAAVNGKVWSAAVQDGVSAALGEDLEPIPNTFGSAATKLHHQRVLTRRVLDAAIQRARGS